MLLDNKFSRKAFKTTKKIPTFQPNYNLNSKSIKSRQNMNKRKIYTETPEKVQGEQRCSGRVSVFCFIDDTCHFGMFETMTSAFVDEFPDLLKNRKILFTAFMCFIEFLLGIPCVMQGGVYVLQIMDWYCSTFSLMILSLTECIVIGWIYGVDRFYKDIEMMIGYQPCVWWKICWCFVTPAMILFIWLFSVTQLSPVTYGDYHYPQWAIAFGWFLGMLSLAPIPTCAIIALLQENGPFMLRVKKLIKPAENFGPAMPKYQEMYQDSLEKRKSFLPTININRCRPMMRKTESIEVASESLSFIS